jgi:hypothetical protein
LQNGNGALINNKYKNEGHDFGTLCMRWVISIIVHLLSFLLPRANKADDNQNENSPHPKHCSNYCLIGIIIVVVVGVSVITVRVFG